jgi:hypothetical protein
MQGTDWRGAMSQGDYCFASHQSPGRQKWRSLAACTSLYPALGASI